MKFIKHENLSFYIYDEVYLPSDDTYLILDNLKIRNGYIVLDLCTGCGILGITAAERAKKVIMTDISPIAVKCAKENVSNNNLKKKIEVRQGDLFDPIKKGEFFDLILFNPPYIPIMNEEKREGLLEKAWNGGKNGRKLIDRFLCQFSAFLKRNGKVQMIQTSLSNLEQTINDLQQWGFKATIEKELKFPFEKIFLILIEKS